VPPPPRRFLLLHGWGNRRPPAHWHWQLAEALRASGEPVLYPQFPDPDNPSLPGWTELLHAELAQLGQGERVVVAHSLGCLLWLNAARTLPAELQVDRVLLVAPPSRTLLAPYPEVHEFTVATPSRDAVLRASGSTRIVCSPVDPYRPEGIDEAFGALGLEVDVIPDGGHLNPDSGYGPWPSMLDWCREPQTRLKPR
jgi:predicted alpha/beta hydrolase family esterase